MNYGKKGTSKKQAELNARSSKIEKKVGITFVKAICICLVAIVIIGTCAGLGVVNGIISNAPDISVLQAAPKDVATFIYDDAGNQIQKLTAPDSDRILVDIKNIPLDLQHAVVAIEDERFYVHNGIDIRGIIRAAFINISEGDLSQGASTITQQLLKNNVFTDWTEESSFIDKFERKFQEQYLAVKHEEISDKDTILEDYLNTINLGAGSYGVQAAANRYFAKDVSELTLSECAVIAGITQNPSQFNPVIHPDNNQERRIAVLDKMLTQGYIDQARYDEALADDVYSRIQATAAEAENVSYYSYYVDSLIDQIMNDLMEKKGYTSTQAYKALYSGGLQIYTTQDPQIQAICDEEFQNAENFPETVEWYLSEYALTIVKEDGSKENFSKEMLKTYIRETVDPQFNLLFSNEEEGRTYVEQYEVYALSLYPGSKKEADKVYFEAQPQASVVIMDQTTGYVLAVVGGRGKKEGSLTLNRATSSNRQPGSTFKILSTYAPALDTKGMTLATVYDNAPFTFTDGTEVNNWDSDMRMYSGLTTIRDAIIQSVNIVAVKTFNDVTPQLGFDYVENFGISSLVESNTNGDLVQSLSLGGITNGVTNLQLTAAFAAIANKGVYTEPVYYSKVLDHSGNVLLENTPVRHSVIKETTAFLLTNAMEDVVSSSDGTGTALNLGSMPVAGKTGTTSEYNDMWFSGYTPYYTCSVWAGYDNNAKLANTDKYRSYSKILWQKIMSRIHQELPVVDFEVPDGIMQLPVCRKSGLLAVAGVCDHDQRGSMVYTEYFERGTQPTTYCDVHVSASVCPTSGKIKNQYCPSPTSKIYIKRPADSEGTTDDSNYALPTGVCTVHEAPPETEPPEETEETKGPDTAPVESDPPANNNGGGNQPTNPVVPEGGTTPIP